MLDFLFKPFSEKWMENFQPTLDQINELAGKYVKFTDENIREQMKIWQQDLQENKTTLQILLPDVFAMVREASRRSLKLKHFDVQIIGGGVIASSMIAEMKTGEGKTLVAALPACLHALTGKGVHIVTSNDYLAKRDAEVMGPLYETLGFTVRYILENSSPQERKEAYGADITYGSNNQFAFDYLRDNMATSLDQKVQRGHYFAIVDEVDNILIDEARTPLIISDKSPIKSRAYVELNEVIAGLQPTHYIVDKSEKHVCLTTEGAQLIEAVLQEKNILQKGEDLYTPANMKFYHVIYNLLKAHKTLKKDRDYVVFNDEVVIVDEFTGRLSIGRRFSKGLHQALEAKEGLKIQEDTETKAWTSYTNYFRLYEKLGGMTGTAMTEMDEFSEIYNLKVVAIPTNRPCIRIDHNDIRLYNLREDLYQDVMQLLIERSARGQPILVCCASVMESETISWRLSNLNISHVLLNAKNHEQEAQIIAKAGIPGTITISTNMAGRGTDIILGGNIAMMLREYPNATAEEISALQQQCEIGRQNALEAGGLLVIIVGAQDAQKTEIQFQGRSGRQGDKGESFIFYSLQDSLLEPMVNFDALNRRMTEAYFPPSKKLHITKRANDFIREIQSVWQANHFEVRKNLLKYDDVAQEQRLVAYRFRDQILSSDQLVSLTMGLINNFIGRLQNTKQTLENYCLEKNIHYKENLLEELKEELNNKNLFHLQFTLLSTFDRHWYKLIIEMEEVKSTIYLISYDQKDPVQEYRSVAYEIFTDMWHSFEEDLFFHLCGGQRLCACGSKLLPENCCEKVSDKQFDIQKLMGEFNFNFDTLFKAPEKETKQSLEFGNLDEMAQNFQNLMNNHENFQKIQQEMDALMRSFEMNNTTMPLENEKTIKDDRIDKVVNKKKNKMLKERKEKEEIASNPKKIQRTIQPVSRKQPIKKEVSKQSRITNKDRKFSTKITQSKTKKQFHGAAKIFTSPKKSKTNKTQQKIDQMEKLDAMKDDFDGE